MFCVHRPLQSKQVLGIPHDTFRKVSRQPLKFGRLLWPGVEFYNKQREIIESVQYNIETFVPAGNMLGKDYVAGFLAVCFFLRPQMFFPIEYVRSIEALRHEITNPFPHTARIITTSVKDDHLRVLWGEIGRFINTCRFPLDHRKGGPLVVHHRELKKVVKPGPPTELCEISYCIGMVSEKGEGMAGHHAAYTLQVIDEASGVDDQVEDQGKGWRKKLLVLSNCNPCTNFFFRAVEEGDIEA